jgi:hypothetical protein
MKSVEFYDLPRPVQERFVAASQASLAPAPLAVKLASPYVGARWFVGSVLAFIVTGLFATQGYGDLAHSAALASGLRALVYCIGFTLGFACLTRGLTLRDRALSLPFTRATYLFPVGVVRATSSSLSVHPLSDLSTVEATAAALSVKFKDGQTFEFPAKDKSQAEAAKRAVDQSRERLTTATKTDSIRHLAALDPLCQTNFPSPFSQDVPFKRPTSLWAMGLLAMALVSGAALGLGVWKVRNTLSANKLAVSARALNTTDAFRQYLARGGKDPEIVQVLLPRAELSEAKALGGVKAIEAYIGKHPESRIQAEVDTALKAALLEALEAAKQPGTLAALNEFASTYPRHDPVKGELAAARHAVYERAAAKATELSVETGRGNNDPAVFFRHLVTFAEKHGPRVEIRFRSQLGKSHKRADTHVRLSAYFGGNSTLPSRYFREKQMREREALAGPLLIEALQSLFSPEVVSFQMGEALPAIDSEEPDDTLPEVTIPTLFIDHRTELSGGYVSPNPRGIFLGAGIFFSSLFVIPGNDYTLKATVPTWRTPSRNVMRLKQRSTGDVYEDLARRSFSLFLSRYLVRVLKTPPDISMPKLDLPQDDEDNG